MYFIIFSELHNLMQFDSASRPRRNTNYLIFMENRYPFDYNTNGIIDSIVKMRIDSSKDTYEATQEVMDKYSSLKHEALV